MVRHMMRGCVAVALVVLSSAWCMAESPAPLEFRSPKAPAEKAYAPSLQRALSSKQAEARRNAADTNVVVENELEVYVVVNVAFETAEAAQQFEMADVSIITRHDKYVDMFIPATERSKEILAALSTEDRYGVKWFELANWVSEPPLPAPHGEEVTPRSIPDEIVRGGLDGLKGQGTIIAVLDTGIDPHHPDFIVEDEQGQPTSRILYYWDTASDAHYAGFGSPAPVRYPNGRPIGTIYSRDDLTADLRAPRSRMVEWDADGHGTGCAGIAAGNGRESAKNIGVAPEADIIAVRLGRSFENSFLFNAICGWLSEKAQDRPLVVSCSFGGQYGGRDGATVEEMQLNSRFRDDQPRRALCVAGGNEGDLPLHAATEFAGGESVGQLAWVAGERTSLNIYFNTSNFDDVEYAIEGDFDLNNVEFTPYVNGLSESVVYELVVPPGSGTIHFRSKSGQSCRADGYVNNEAYAWFSNLAGPLDSQVGTPGTCTAAITVGSYDWNDRFDQYGATVVYLDFLKDYQPLQIGGLSTYSSRGYRRDGMVKPDIVAPGQFYAAPATRNAEVVRDTSGYYRLFNGTSAATPYTAGIVALIMEKNPNITLGQIKELLYNYSTKDEVTGETPNTQWGYGKLDMAAVRRIMERVGQ